MIVSTFIAKVKKLELSCYNKCVRVTSMSEKNENLVTVIAVIIAIIVGVILQIVYKLPIIVSVVVAVLLGVLVGFIAYIIQSIIRKRRTSSLI